MTDCNLGLIHIYCGDGKGKTSASVGLSIRCVGCGYKVLFLQFLKDGKSSELGILKDIPGITVISGKCVEKFTFQMNENEKSDCKTFHTENFKSALDLTADGSYNLLVLDECIGAINANTLDEGLIIDFLQNKPRNLEVVLTGRNPSPRLLALADYVTEMKKIKHPYDKGIPSRKGIEV